MAAEVRLEGEAGELALELLGRLGAGPQRQDLNVAVSARVASFSGRVASAWLEHGRAEAFVSALEGLARAGSGTASLESTGPGEFAVTISAEKAGTAVRVEVRLGTVHYTGRGTIESRMNGAFTIDGQQLEPALQWWRGALSA